MNAIPYVVPSDSMDAPLVIPIDENRLKKTLASQVQTQATDTQIHLPGTPQIVVAGKPFLSTISTVPKAIPAQDSSFIAGIPQIITVKDIANKSQNPGNFRSFGKLQGLKYPAIFSVIEDKSGNLWFGTVGGGIYKYDGMFFTNYTEKEGLCNNYINRASGRPAMEFMDRYPSLDYQIRWKILRTF